MIISQLTEIILMNKEEYCQKNAVLAVSLETDVLYRNERRFRRHVQKWLYK